MHTIVFEADMQDGMIKIPSRYKSLKLKNIKVTALLDDIEMAKPDGNLQAEKSRQFSDEYIDNHWRELIMTSSTEPQQDDDKVLQEEYGAYLSAKHSF